MKVLEQSSERGVTEIRFDLEVDGTAVPGLLWLPSDAAGPRPLVLQGHGGTQHKRVANILSLARRLVRHQGYAVAAIDAPGHGDRMTPEDLERNRERRRAGGALRLDPARRRQLAQRARQAVTEWRATLDALQQLDPVGAAGPVGYWGVSMGTAFGVPLLAAEPRIDCAVLGLAGLREGQDAFAKDAAQIKVPLLFMIQRDDPLMTPEQALALFDAFGSEVKSMHVNPGPHVGIPAFEVDYFETFFARHLGRAAPPPAA